MTEQLSARDCFDIGFSAFHMNEEEKATKYFEEALKLDPATYDAMNQLGIIALQNDNDDLAVEWWLKSIDVEENSEAFSNLGFYYSKNEQLQKAKPYLIKASEVNPHLVDVIIQRAFIEMTAGEFDLTEELLTPLLAHDVAFEEAHLMLSQVKVEQKQYDQAIEVLERLIEKYPDSVQGKHRLAKAHWVCENFEASGQYYGDVLEVIPFQLDIIKEYGVLLREHLSIEKSIELFQKTMTSVTNDWELHWHLGLSQEAANQPDQALKSYSHALVLNPTDGYLRQKVAQLNAKA